MGGDGRPRGRAARPRPVAGHSASARRGLQGSERVVGFYVAVAIAFGVVLQAGGEYGTRYFAGYIVEKSMSVDNLFVFVIIMTTFTVPEQHQRKVLRFGISIALVLRAIFIALGAALLSLFSFMSLIFGLLLIWTAVQLHRHRDEDPDIEDNGLVIAIGGTDLLFALDSIPAVFGMTEEPYIVFAANAFALLGLRALFFLGKGLLDWLVYLSVGLAIISCLHWGKAYPALGAWAFRRRPRDPDPGAARLHRRHALPRDGCEPGQGPPRPRCCRPRGVPARPLGHRGRTAAMTATSP